VNEDVRIDEVSTGVSEKHRFGVDFHRHRRDQANEYSWRAMEDSLDRHYQNHALMPFEGQVDAFENA
jgi:hypothetical protein